VHEQDETEPAGRKLTRPLLLTLIITITFALVELLGGLLSGSLALISDSGHMFTDILALALSLWAGYMATRMTNERQTFGLLRVEILVALVNGVALVVISLFIIWEGILRIQEPVSIEAPLMLTVASAGLLANIAGVMLLRHGAEENLNVKGAFLHVLGDMLSSVGVIAAAILILLFDLRIADPIISMAIGVIIIYGAWKIIAQSIYILLEFAPGHIDVDELKAEMQKLPGVVEAHDIHVWTLGSGIYALSAHIQVKDQPVSACSCIIKDVEGLLKEKYRITHSTLQIEYAACQDEVCVFRRQAMHMEDGK